MKVKTSHIGIIIGAVALLILAGCASKTPQEQIQLSELDKQTYGSALSTQNLELCAAIEEKTLKENCELTIKEQKLKEEIVSAKDSAKCAKLTIEQLKKSCDIEIKTAFEAEKKETEITKENSEQNTKLNQIMQGGDVSKCSQMEDVYFQNLCRDYVYFNQALLKKDQAVCKKIMDNQKKSVCEQLSK